MKVILSIEPVRFPLTGIGRYTYELARHLQASDTVEELHLLGASRFVDHLPASAAPRPAISSALRQRLLASDLLVDLYRGVASVRKWQLLKRHGDGIYHGPNFYLPPFPGASVVTIHDLSVYRWEHCHPPERVRYMRKEMALTLKRADMLIADSEFVRQEIIAFFGWPADKVRAVPLASTGTFRPHSREELQPTMTSLQLQADGYCLFSGTIEPRKNLDTLLDAYGALPQALRRRWPLVLCGYRGWESEALHARIEQAQREGWVRYLGYVPEEQLAALFAGARLFVFPSLYEGFGLPLLEALASGVPVVCSNAASLPEVSGGVAAACDPLDTERLKALIERGLEDEAWRERAKAQGLRRAAEFSWQDCARQTVAVYRELANVAA